MKARSVLLSAIAAALCAACSPRLAPPAPSFDATESLRDELADDALELLIRLTDDLTRVESPVRVRNAELCGDHVAPYLGVRTFWSQQGDPSPIGAAWRRRFQLGRDLAVVSVEPGSPAARAGIEPGDSLLRVNGRALDRSVDYRDILSDEPERAPDLSVRKRDGHEVEIRVERHLACTARGVVEMNDAILVGWIWDAPGRIVLTRGLIELTENDDELAVVFAHNLAHDLHGALPHRSRRYDPNELAIDRVGLFLAARAGFDVSAAPAIWSRIASERPSDIAANEQVPPNQIREAPHARIAARIVAMGDVVREIESQQRAGSELLP
jgi:hypothetical protein